MALPKLKSATVFAGPDALRQAIAAGAKRAGMSAADAAAFVKSGTDPSRITKAGFPIFRKGGTLLDALGAPAGGSVKAAPAMPSDADLAGLAEKRGLEWKDGARDRVVPYWGSDERPDAHGDIVECDWIFDEYEKNPVLLAQHEWDGDPIGAALDWQVRHRSDADYTGPALWLLQLFAEEAASARAASILRLVRAGIMRSCSVGFWSERIVDVQDPDERLALGLGTWGWILQGNHLLELSPVSLPANPGAHVVSLLARAVESGAVKSADVELLRELAAIQARSAPKAERRSNDAMWVGLARAMFPGVKFDAKSDAAGDTFEPEATAADPAAETEPAEVVPAWAQALAAEIKNVNDRLDAVQSVLVGEIKSVLAVADDIRVACERGAKGVDAAVDGTDTERESASAADVAGGNGAVGDPSAAPTANADGGLMRTLADLGARNKPGG